MTKILPAFQLEVQLLVAGTYRWVAVTAPSGGGPYLLTLAEAPPAAERPDEYARRRAEKLVVD